MKRLRLCGCALSLVLCLAMLFAWGRCTGTVDFVSYATWEEHGSLGTLKTYSILSRGGSVGWYCLKQTGPVGRERPPSFWSWQVSPFIASDNGRNFPALNQFGFAVGRAPWGATVAMVPYWLLVMLLSIAPLRSLLRFRRRYVRSVKGLCLECGYDLRASEDRCPECGTTVEPDPAERNTQ